MRLKLDENLPRLARDRLISEGWDVHDLHEEVLADVVDELVQAACEREDRILVTLDLDFADTTRRDRPASSSYVHAISRFLQFCSVWRAPFARWRRSAIRAALWIVEPERLRFRDHPTNG